MVCKDGYLVCDVCGSNGGRTGCLIGNPSKGQIHECVNCHDTRVSGNITFHPELIRTDEEIVKTMEINTKIKCEHEWVLNEDWSGYLEGDSHCIKCGTGHPNNY